MSIKSNVSLFFGVLILFLLSHCSGGGNGETTTLPPPTGASSTPVVQQPTTVPLNQFERNIYITVRNASAPVTPDPAYNIYRDFSIKSVDPVAQMSGGQANYSSITLMTGKALLALSRSGIAVTASKVSGAGIGTVLQVHDIKSPNSLFSNIDIFSDSQPFLFMKGHMKAIINDTGSTIAFMTLDSSGLQGVHVIQIDPSNGQKLLENQLPLKSIIPSGAFIGGVLTPFNMIMGHDGYLYLIGLEAQALSLYRFDISQAITGNYVAEKMIDLSNFQYDAATLALINHATAPLAPMKSSIILTDIRRDQLTTLNWLDSNLTRWGTILERNNRPTALSSLEVTFGGMLRPSMKTNLTLWSHENRFYFGVEHNSTTLEDSIVKILNPLSTSSGVEEIFKSAAGEEIISITEPTSY